MFWFIVLNSPLVLGLFAAFFLEKKRKAREPKTLPFVWGYYIASVGVMYGVPIFALSLYGWANGNKEMPIYLAASVVLLLANALLFRRSRIGWVAGTILNFNPVWWVINAVYGRNRWREFRSGL